MFGNRSPKWLAGRIALLPIPVKLTRAAGLDACTRGPGGYTARVGLAPNKLSKENQNRLTWI